MGCSHWGMVINPSIGICIPVTDDIKCLFVFNKKVLSSEHVESSIQDELIGLPDNGSAREKFLEFSMLSKPKSGFPTRVFSIYMIPIQDMWKDDMNVWLTIEQTTSLMINGRGDVWSEHFINRESEYWIHLSKKSETVPDCGFLEKIRLWWCPWSCQVLEVHEVRSVQII